MFCVFMQAFNFAMQQNSGVTLALSSFFVSCEEKDYYCRFGRTTWFRPPLVSGRSHRGHKGSSKSLSAFCSIFELGGKTKHLMTGPSGNGEFCFPSTLSVPLSFASGNTEGLGDTKLPVSLEASHFFAHSALQKEECYRNYCQKSWQGRNCKLPRPHKVKVRAINNPHLFSWKSVFCTIIARDIDHGNEGRLQIILKT